VSFFVFQATGENNQHNYTLLNSGLSIVTVTDLFAYIDRLQTLKTAKPSEFA